MRFLGPASGEASHWPIFGFIHLTLHPPFYILLFSLQYSYMVCILFSFIRVYYPVTSQYRITIPELKLSIFIVPQLYIYSVMLIEFLVFLLRKKKKKKNGFILKLTIRKGLSPNILFYFIQALGIDLTTFCEQSTFFFSFFFQYFLIVHNIQIFAQKFTWINLVAFFQLN